VFRLKAKPIVLTERQRDFLKQVLRREKSTQQQVRRINVILLSNQQSTNRSIATRLHLTLQTVRRWRKRWKPVDRAMHTAEGNGYYKQVEHLVLEALCDEERSGRPAEFTPEQICQVVAIGCEKPDHSDRPISHWTAGELAGEAIKRGIVADISPRSEGRFF
jgi:putative transposase